MNDESVQNIALAIDGLAREVKSLRESVDAMNSNVLDNICDNLEGIAKCLALKAHAEADPDDFMLIDRGQQQIILQDLFERFLQ